MKTIRSRAEADVAAIVSSAGNARGKAVAAELAAMRKAFDAAAQSIETLLASPLRVDAEVGTFVDGLAKQFEALATPAGDLDSPPETARGARDAEPGAAEASRQGPDGPRSGTGRPRRRA